MNMMAAMLIGVTVAVLYTSFSGMKGASAVGRVVCIGIYILLIIFTVTTLSGFGGLGGLFEQLPENYNSMGNMPTQRIIAWILGGCISTAVMQAVLQPVSYTHLDVYKRQVLEETREALTLAGESGPYILFPHSLSGIEAIYWGQKYPSEVKGIIGLDAAVPSIYLSWGEEILNKSAESMAKISVLYQAGMVRLHPEIYDTDPAMTGDILSDEEKAAYRAMVMKSFMTKNMVDEARYAYANAAKVDSCLLYTSRCV